MKTIPLTQGYVALVDDEDYERVLAAGPWQARRDDARVYANHSFFRGGRYGKLHMHRYVLGLGPDDPDVDHINGNGLDNRRENLRRCTQSQNLGNRRKIRPASSRFKGVYLNRRNGSWRALIRVDKRKYDLGSFALEVDAARAYDAAAKQLFGEFARPNF